MEINKDYFKQVLNEVIVYSENLGFVIHTNDNIDDFFKGDLDGLNIYLRQIDYEEDLFNILHMVGHSIQWSISDELRALGKESLISINTFLELINNKGFSLNQIAYDSKKNSFYFYLN